MTPRRGVAVVLLGFELFSPAAPAVAAERADDTVFPRSGDAHEPHARAHVMIAAGVALTASSFVFSAAADHAYRRYQGDSDPAQITRDYDTAHRDDRISAALLLGGTGALALGVYWRFIHHGPSASASRLGLAPSLTPDHAGLALRVALP